MNEKITTSELAELLAQRTPMTPDEAHAFIKRIFSRVVAVLQEEKYLKIKDLGTFKLIRVSSRESVAVNTGERILIDGYDKISFTPENTLRDLINKPFAHFETISLNEGVDFEEETTDPDEEEMGEEEIEEPPKPLKKPLRSLSKTASRKKLAKREEEEEDEEEMPERERELPRASRLLKTGTPPKEEVEKARKPGGAKKPDPVRKGPVPVSKEVPREVEEKPTPAARRGTGRIPMKPASPGHVPAVPEEEEKAARPVIRKKEEEPVVLPSRAEVRKRKSILIQEPVPVPVPEEKPKRKSKTILPEKSHYEDPRYRQDEFPEEEEEDYREESDLDGGPEERYAPVELPDPEERYAPEPELPDGKKKVQEPKRSPKKRRSFAVPFFICLSLLVVLVGTLSVAYFYYPQWLKDLLHLEGQSITIITVDAPSVREEAKETEEAEPVIPVPEPEAEDPEVEAQAAQKPDQPVLVAGERANPRDFQVTGTLTTLTITAGTSLARISKQYYGSRDLWTFIVEYNPDIITNPDNIPVGKSIRIPKLEKK